jgi:hypothetical protein
MTTASFAGGRTTGALRLSLSDISCGMRVRTSFGACSASSSIQSKPIVPSSSVTMGLASEAQHPIRVSLLRSDWRKVFGMDWYGVDTDIVSPQWGIALVQPYRGLLVVGCPAQINVF